MTGDLRKTLNTREWGALIAILLLALLPGFFSIPVMDRDEARYSQASSQMMETGDYIDIRFQEDPRWVKPAGIYWMQVATSAPFGGPDAPIWAFRLPSLIGVLIGGIVTAWLGARIIGAQGGIAAGVMLGLTLMAAVEARTAKTDAMLLAAGVIAQAALFFLLTQAKGSPRPKFIGAPLIFWAATGAALMIKGPIVTLVSLSTIAAYGIWTRDWGVLKRIRPLFGVLVAAAIALPWLVAINIKTDGGFFMESVGHALLGKVAESDDSHAGPFGYHTLLLPITFWPGTLFVGLAAGLAWTKRQHPAVKFLICWLVPTWLIFELIATKLPHYIFPAMPALAILAAWGIKDAAELWAKKWPRRIHLAFLGLFVLATGILAAVPMIAADYLGTAMMSAPNVLAIIFGLIAIGAGIMAARRPSALPRLAVLMAAGIGTYWAVFQCAIPALKPLWPSYYVAQEVGKLTGCEEIMATTAGYREPSNVRYLGTRTYLADTGAQSAEFLLGHRECGVAIIDVTEQQGFLAAMSEGGVAPYPVNIVSGHNYVKGDDLDLTIFILGEGQLSWPSAQE
ncbi:ArnT family glycosyltransferase [Parvularcula marina]|uniref:ArnT family glycosyltransferase n=1 Tax=Parvularcula marina TaxID=2292771 RepID=UPI003517E371